MRLTAFSDVSLRVLMFLAGLDQQQQVSSQQVAQGVGVPYNHVAKAVAFLAQEGWVESRRGRSGGVSLSEAGRQVSVGQVVRRAEGDQPLVDCGSPEGGCPLRGSCLLRGVLDQAREVFLRSLDGVVVASLTSSAGSGPVFLELSRGPRQ